MNLSEDLLIYSALALLLMVAFYMLMSAFFDAYKRHKDHIDDI